ncbi:hypothetical protein JTE90_006240 [Oedothorax gibbosus]|uniref:Uncharacterized protein n=1 Tax=Oedothorax gibbosus TaxID=931172 RepID=A0AAV6VTH0_9ARAC|nr:hypothetical protein JTE90_006240 [Oedothorax gibbosus]
MSHETRQTVAISPKRGSNVSPRNRIGAGGSINKDGCFYRNTIEVHIFKAITQLMTTQTTFLSRGSLSNTGAVREDGDEMIVRGPAILGSSFKNGAKQVNLLVECY